MYWLSFADPELPKGSQFLGVVIVRSNDFITAVAYTHAKGINPGGEVRGVEFPDDARPIPEDMIDCLLSYEDIETKLGGAERMP